MLRGVNFRKYFNDLRLTKWVFYVLFLQKVFTSKVQAFYVSVKSCFNDIWLPTHFRLHKGRKETILKTETIKGSWV